MDAEQTRKENERKIVRFTNIDTEESFSHNYDGITVTVEVGKSRVMRLPEGEHLATHLARKILGREKKRKGAKDDPKAPLLWTDEEVNELKAKILQPIGSESPTSISKEEIRKKDQENLEKKYGSEKDPKSNEKEVTKADVIKSLKERGVTADVNKSKEELLSQLMEIEANPHADGGAIPVEGGSTPE
tara:strand:+ start:1648 stop:2211 length:564 start_codon:yes stop_codon:yes gene_type:complete